MVITMYMNAVHVYYVPLLSNPQLLSSVCQLVCHMAQLITMSSPIRESVDSLCRDDADMPMPPYVRKACNRPNAAFISLFRYLTVIYGCFST